MKKIILSLVFFILTSSSAYAAYETTERMEILSIDSVNQNLVVQRKNDTRQWLLHYKGKCGDDLAVGESPVVVVQNDLDSKNDYIKIDSSTRCEIDQAEVITGMINVEQAYKGNTSAIIQTENGDRYYITYGSACNGLRNFKTVYTEQAGQSFNEGDNIYLPDNLGQCYVFYADRIRENVETLAPEDAKTDETRPTSVSGVKVIPTNGSVFLVWRPATDNVGVDHYVISYYHYSINSSEYDLDGMPNKSISVRTTAHITGLTNEETYFFYIAAVDAEGNVSSEWSEEVSGTPRNVAGVPSSYTKTKLNLRLVQETDDSFLFRWDRISAYDHQTITLDAGRERDFGLTSWNNQYLRVSKEDSRKGKTLTLTVRCYNSRGSRFEESIEFEF